MSNQKTEANQNGRASGLAAAPSSAICTRCNQKPHQCLCELASSWEDSGCCGMCDGSGVIDGYEDDPNWYEPGETKPCPQCGGSGL